MNPVSSNNTNIFSQFKTPSYISKSDHTSSKQIWAYETISEGPKKKKSVLPAILAATAILAAVGLMPKIAKGLKLKDKLQAIENPEKLDKLGEKIKYHVLKGVNAVADKIKVVEDKIAKRASIVWQAAQVFFKSLKPAEAAKEVVKEGAEVAEKTV